MSLAYLRADVRTTIQAVSGEVRVWVREEHPARYAELCQLEVGTRQLEKMKVRAGYESMGQRLIEGWHHMERLFRARGGAE